MTKKTLILVLGLITLTSLLLVLALSQNKNTQEKAPIIETVSTPSLKQTNLYLSPNSLVVSSSTGEINVDLSTEENNVTAVQLEMAYDPKILGGIDIKPGDFFDNPDVLMKTIDQKNGRISYALILPPDSLARKGTGTVAVISFKVLNKKAEQTTISFLPKTLVTAEGVDPSVLKTSTGATIIFQQQ